MRSFVPAKSTFQMFAFYVQQCFMLAQATGNLQLAQQAAADMQQYAVAAGVPQSGAALARLGDGDNPAESGITRNARERTSNATKPREG